ncbi:MAG: ATP synthase F0 subunit B [Myxococcota bacterium]
MADYASIAPLVGGLLTAAGDAHHSGPLTIDWVEMISLFANTVIFFGFLIWKLRPLVSDGLVQRRKTMAEQLEIAKKKQEEAEAKAAEYAEKLENLEAEVQRIVKNYESEAEADIERMRVDTEKAIERLSRDNENTIRQEVLKAEQLIRESAVAATLEAAEALVK